MVTGGRASAKPQRGASRAPGTVIGMNDSIRAGLDSLAQQVAESVAEVKPQLRGWLHLATAPLTLAAGIVLIALSPTAATRARLGGLRRLGACCCSPSRRSTTAAAGRRACAAVLRRFDHANIFLLIAGTYTPFSLLLLQRHARGSCCWRVIWAGALLGVASGSSGSTRRAGSTCRSTSRSAGRPSSSCPSSPRGVRSGSASGVGIAVLVLIAAGGALYMLGGVVYGFRRPDPWPRWFGFHEVFHTLHDPGVRRPLRRRLAGDVLPALNAESSHDDSADSVPLCADSA